MNSDYMIGASGLLAEVADLLCGLDLVNLPALGTLAFSYSYSDRAWNVAAQLSGYVVGEEAQIDAVRTWAGALSGELHLDNADHSSTYGGSYRRLQAVKALEFGVSLHVWTHLATAPAPALAAA